MSEILDLRKNKTTEPSTPKGSEDVQPPTIEKIYGQILPEDQPVDKRLIVISSIFLFIIGTGFIFWQRSFISAIFFLLLGGVMIIVAFKPRKTVVWEIGTHGLALDTFFYPYKHLISFWIEYQPGYLKELSFRSKKWYHPYIKIPLADQNPREIRTYLLQFIPEERHEDTLVETISRKLGI